jgi:hypothetical protein
MWNAQPTVRNLSEHPCPHIDSQLWRLHLFVREGERQGRTDADYLLFARSLKALVRSLKALEQPFYRAWGPIPGSDC